MTTTEAALRECPFCGTLDVEMRESITDAQIACNNCGARTGFVYFGASEAANAAKKRELADAWNRRSQPSPASSTAGEVVALVIAAREAWEEHGASGDDLDRALEKFAALVPYENEPETEPLSPSSGEPASVAVEADEKVLSAALNQNDAMRQELTHVGNLVSDLARAMKVDEANDDGTWPDLAGRIEKLKASALSKPTPVEAGLREAERRAIARCLEIVRETRDGFLSEEYAVGQPASSFAERFTCDQVAQAIEREFAIGTIEQCRLLGKPTPMEQYRAALSETLPVEREAECPPSPTGRHQVDTSMESGPNNCFHCDAPMGKPSPCPDLDSERGRGLA